MSYTGNLIGEYSQRIHNYAHEADFVIKALQLINLSLK